MQYQQNVENAKRQRVSMRVPLAYEWYVETIHDLTEAGWEQLRCECEHGVGVQKSRCENYIEVEDSHFGWRLCESYRPLPEDFARQARAMSNYVKVPRRVVAIEIRQGTSPISRKVSFSV